jgi:hypothetical protein
MIRTKKAVLITFSVRSSEFHNNSERNKFFRALYGWRQVVPKENKEYVYEREGLLDEMPHLKVDQSSFIVPENDSDKIFDFFDEWSKKVIWKNFKVLLEDDDLEKMFEEEDEDEG